MRQLVHVEPGQLEWRDVPEPKLAGPREALARPIAVARCDVDSLMYAEKDLPRPTGTQTGNSTRVAQPVRTRISREAIHTAQCLIPLIDRQPSPRPQRLPSSTNCPRCNDLTCRRPTCPPRPRAPSPDQPSQTQRRA